jgi:hypothetical protein
MGNIIDWAKSHPYLLGSVVLAVVVLYVLYANSQSAAASAAATTSATPVSTGPDDTIQQAEIAAGTSVAQAQLAANASVAQTNAAVDVAAIQTQGGVIQSNNNTQAALTLGLAQDGQATTSILSLLGAQPGASAAATNYLVSGVANMPNPGQPGQWGPIQLPVTNPTPVEIDQPISTTAPGSTYEDPVATTPPLTSADLTALADYGFKASNPTDLAHSTWSTANGVTTDPYTIGVEAQLEAEG